MKIEFNWIHVDKKKDIVLFVIPRQCMQSVTDDKIMHAMSAVVFVRQVTTLNCEYAVYK